MNFLFKKKTAFHDREGCPLLEIIINSSYISISSCLLTHWPVWPVIDQGPMKTRV